MGRPRALSDESSERAQRLHQAGRSVSYIARTLNVSRATVMRELRRIEQSPC